jgi:hypothetical protein
VIMNLTNEEAQTGKGCKFQRVEEEQLAGY